MYKSLSQSSTTLIVYNIIPTAPKTTKTKGCHPPKRFFFCVFFPQPTLCVPCFLGALQQVLTTNHLQLVVLPFIQQGSPGFGGLGMARPAEVFQEVRRGLGPDLR